MPREIVVGNGRIAIAFDKNMNIRDFFFPRVGLENHVVGHMSRMGVWVDGSFSWMDDGWDIAMNYMPEALVTKCFATNKTLGVSLEINDAIYSYLDIYAKKIIATNQADAQREVQFFFSNDFHIYEEEYGDTAMYEPRLAAIIHYKRQRYFLVNGITDDGSGIFQFATGQKESYGKEGTWRDAEDGVLQGNPIAQGAVDSTVSFKVDMKPKSKNTLYYWIACGTDFDKVQELNGIVKTRTVEQMLLETENYWSAWVNRQNLNLAILPKKIARLFKISLMVMRSHVDNHGAIIASYDSDILQFNRDSYSYMWPRDAAICAIAFDMAGFQEVSRLFFGFCNQVITDDGYFRHKYWSDGSVGSTWHALVTEKLEMQLPIQLDETALVVYALWRHFQRYHDLEFISQVYPRLVINTSKFMETYRDLETSLPKPTFDMWEEHAAVFTSTASCVCSALESAAKFAKVFYDSKRQESLNQIVNQMKQGMKEHLYDRRLNRFVRAILPDGTYDVTVDSNLSFTFLYGAFGVDNQEVKDTMKAVMEHLWLRKGIGGLARYENDNYHRVSNEVPGNPWIICTLWLARWHIRLAQTVADLKEAMMLLEWVANHSLPSGLLAEQLHPFDGSPISVSPLAWSHAEYVIAVCEYLEKYQQLESIR